tara:strand:+ start:161 stop:781 length:621 start_codon:yes stop_codon:yes gene_type:complete
MLDAIISGIGKIKKVNDLKNLQARGDLSFDEFSTMKYLLMYGRGDSVEFDYFSRNKSNLESSLNDFWEGKTDAKDFFAERHTSYVSGIRASKRTLKPSGALSYSKRTPVNKPKPPIEKTWGFKITKDFMNSIKKVDKNLQGRILEAITKITLSPKTIMGDTIKPLTGDLEGYWRYRIGDYRLIYKPVEKWSEILLISFSSRGTVYQ